MTAASLLLEYIKGILMLNKLTIAKSWNHWITLKLQYEYLLLEFVIATNKVNANGEVDTRQDSLYHSNRHDCGRIREIPPII